MGFAVMSKPQVFDQCRRWLRTHLPQAELVPSSPPAAVERAANEPGWPPSVRKLRDIYGVPALFRGIQDSSNNITRFLVIEKPKAPRAGQNTVMFVTKDRPGALVDVLADFQSSGLNLSHRQAAQRPRKLGIHLLRGCVGPPRCRSHAVGHRKAREHCVSLRVVGSYPAHKTSSSLGSTGFRLPRSTMQG